MSFSFKYDFILICFIDFVYMCVFQQVATEMTPLVTEASEQPPSEPAPATQAGSDSTPKPAENGTATDENKTGEEKPPMEEPSNGAPREKVSEPSVEPGSAEPTAEPPFQQVVEQVDRPPTTAEGQDVKQRTADPSAAALPASTADSSTAVLAAADQKADTPSAGPGAQNSESGQTATAIDVVAVTAEASRSTESAPTAPGVAPTSEQAVESAAPLQGAPSQGAPTEAATPSLPSSTPAASVPSTPVSPSQPSTSPSSATSPAVPAAAGSSVPSAGTVSESSHLEFSTVTVISRHSPVPPYEPPPSEPAVSAGDQAIPAASEAVSPGAQPAPVSPGTSPVPAPQPTPGARPAPAQKSVTIVEPVPVSPGSQPVPISPTTEGTPASKKAPTVKTHPHLVRAFTAPSSDQPPTPTSPVPKKVTKTALQENSVSDVLQTFSMITMFILKEMPHGCFMNYSSSVFATDLNLELYMHLIYCEVVLAPTLHARFCNLPDYVKNGLASLIISLISETQTQRKHIFSKKFSSILCSVFH